MGIGRLVARGVPPDHRKRLQIIKPDFDRQRDGGLYRVFTQRRNPGIRKTGLFAANEVRLSLHNRRKTTIQNSIVPDR
jgi:hypothetical protein